MSRRSLLRGALAAVGLIGAGWTMSAPAPRPSRPRTLVGVASPGLPRDLSALAEFSARGRPAELALWYQDFTSRLDLDAVRALPAAVTPIVTWEPFVAGAGVEQPDFALRTIWQGRHDAYLWAFASELVRLDRPIVLRFAHEPNGDWYPWSEQRNGNSPGDYRRAWVYVQDLLAAAGVGESVSWMWSPNVAYPGSLDLHGLFPGDDRVDLIGLDGYNWGTSRGGAWQSPMAVFGPTMLALQSMSRRPLLLAEVGCSEEGGDKAAWIELFGRYLEASPWIDGYVWFDYDKETDWRVNSSLAAEQAYARMVAGLSDGAAGYI